MLADVRIANRMICSELKIAFVVVRGIVQVRDATVGEVEWPRAYNCEMPV